MRTRVIQGSIAILLTGCLRVEELNLVTRDAGTDAGEVVSPDDQDAGDASALADAAVESEPERYACRSDFDCNSRYLGPAILQNPDAGREVCAPDGYCLERGDAFGATVVTTSDREIHNLVGDGATLYWMTRSSGAFAGDRADAELWRLNPGSEPERVAADLEDASHLRIYGDYVYWSGMISWKVMRMPKSGGAAETLYGFEGCHNFVLDDDRLILVSRAGVEIGSLDGSAPLDKLGDISVFRPDQPGYAGECGQRVAMEGGEVFYKRDDTLFANRVDTHEERAIAPHPAKLLDVRDGNVYSLLQVVSDTTRWEFLAGRLDLSSGIDTTVAEFNLPESDASYVSIEGELHDGYIYHFAERFEDVSDIRVSVVRAPAASGFKTKAEQVIPLEWRPRGIPPHIVTYGVAHAAAADGYYVAHAYGPGGVLYKFALPPAP